LKSVRVSMPPPEMVENLQDQSLSSLPYRRVILKLSGESLSGEGGFGLCSQRLGRIASVVAEVVALGVQLGIVVGAGNLFRGRDLSQAGVAAVTADRIGMLGTVMNALVLQDALRTRGLATALLSALAVPSLARGYHQEEALEQLESGRVLLLSGGTGNPLFTTDSAACLRAVELGAQLMLKATKVSGVYAVDPAKGQQAGHYKRLSYDQVLEGRLQVMDLSAVCLCRDHGLPVRVFHMEPPERMISVIRGAEEGTLIDAGIDAGSDNGEGKADA